MTTATLKQNAIQIAQAVTIAPVLLAALIGAIPLIIPCITCRCCKGIVEKNNGICSELKRQLAKINRLHPENHARGTASLNAVGCINAAKSLARKQAGTHQFAASIP